MFKDILYKLMKLIIKSNEVLILNPSDTSLVEIYDDTYNKITIVQDIPNFYNKPNVTVERTMPYYSMIPKTQLYYNLIHFSDIEDPANLYQLLTMFKSNITHEGIYIIENVYNEKNTQKTKAVYDWLNINKDFDVLLTGFNTIVLSPKTNIDFYKKSIIEEAEKFYALHEKVIEIKQNTGYSTSLDIFESINEFEYNYDNESIEKIVELSFNYITPKSVIDVGCGAGKFLQLYKTKGINVFGIEGTLNKELQYTLKENEYKIQNLNESFNCGKYDLAICLEVAEHLKQNTDDNLIKSLTNSSNIILFSAAIPGQLGKGHINCQWPSYWKVKFEKQGFVMLDIIRKNIWFDESINWWYRQNLFLAVKKDLVANYVTEIPPVLDLVHPSNHK